MDRWRLSQVVRRSSGEVAFDRCFFPWAAFFVFGVIATALMAVLPPSPQPRGEVELAAEVPVPGKLLWALFAVGLVVAFFWVRAFVGVVRVWHDPSARVLRFSALGLLVPLAAMALRLLCLPFF